MSGIAVDLNVDLGEGTPHDAGLLEVVTSASVACGLHAGSPQTMVDTARAAAAQNVAVGAHPSYDDRDGFGRRPVEMAATDLVALVAYQVGAMAAAAGVAGTAVRFVKPHGALYNRAAVDPMVAEAVVAAVEMAGRSVANPSLALLCPAGSEMARRAEAARLPWFAEAFADRLYAPDGTLASRSRPGAVIDDPAVVARQALDLALRGRARTFEGAAVEVTAHSICLHGDTPGAFELARSVRRALEDAGVSIAPFLGF